MFSKLRGEYSVFLVFLSLCVVDADSVKCEHMTSLLRYLRSQHQNQTLRVHYVGKT